MQEQKPCVQKKEEQEVLDCQTGLKNDKIKRENIDETNMKRYNILKQETFDYFKRQPQILNNCLLLKQLISDVEWVFKDDHASGAQKQELVYFSFLQYLYQIPNINYDTYTKSNIINLIEEIFQANKKDLLKICIQFHPGLKAQKKGICSK